MSELFAADDSRRTHHAARVRGDAHRRCQNTAALAFELALCRVSHSATTILNVGIHVLVSTSGFRSMRCRWRYLLFDLPCIHAMFSRMVAVVFGSALMVDSRERPIVAHPVAVAANRMATTPSPAHVGHESA
jgi:hypothetical protein